MKTLLLFLQWLLVAVFAQEESNMVSTHQVRSFALKHSYHQIIFKADDETLKYNLSMNTHQWTGETAVEPIILKEGESNFDFEKKIMALIPYDQNNHHNLSDFQEIELFVIEVPQNFSIMIGRNFLAEKTVVPLNTPNFTSLLHFIVEHR